MGTEVASGTIHFGANADGLEREMSAKKTGIARKDEGWYGTWKAVAARCSLWANTDISLPSVVGVAGWP